MAWRNYDWECMRKKRGGKACGAVREELVDVPTGSSPPRSIVIQCRKCRRTTEHERRISMPAKYLGEKSFSPVVYGGKFDTAGYRAAPPLPIAPDGLGADGFIDFVRQKDYREARRARDEVHSENMAKRKRLAAHKRNPGSVDFRKNRLKGDPKLMS